MNSITTLSPVCMCVTHAFMAEGYARRLGVEAIEVCEEKLEEDRLEEQMTLPERHGLEVSSIQPAVRTLYPSRTQPEPEEVGERTNPTPGRAARA